MLNFHFVLFLIQVSVPVDCNLVPRVFLLHSATVKALGTRLPSQQCSVVMLTLSDSGGSNVGWNIQMKRLLGDEFMEIENEIVCRSWVVLVLITSFECSQCQPSQWFKPYSRLETKYWKVRWMSGTFVYFYECYNACVSYNWSTSPKSAGSLWKFHLGYYSAHLLLSLKHPVLTCWKLAVSIFHVLYSTKSIHEILKIVLQTLKDSVLNS